jgi:hypothetical protein
MKLIPDKAWHIEREYGSLDYKCAVVLDIGAEYGCTAEFFLSRGASRVIACEANPDWRLKLREWAEGKPVEVRGPLNALNADELLGMRPDIVKVDCEGCEKHLLDVPDELFGQPKAWVIETHTRSLYDVFSARLKRLGYTVRMICDFGDSPNKAGQVCKVFTATR